MTANYCSPDRSRSCQCRLVDPGSTCSAVAVNVGFREFDFDDHQLSLTMMMMRLLRLMRKMVLLRMLSWGYCFLLSIYWMA